MTKPFAYFEGEDPEQTEAYIASAEVQLEGAKQRGETEAVKNIEAELKRVRGGSTAKKQTRIRGEVPVAEAGDE
jgi:hypothetical protein